MTKLLKKNGTLSGRQRKLELSGHRQYISYRLRNGIDPDMRDIARLIKASGKSYAQMARENGPHRKTYSRYARGITKLPMKATFTAILNGLGGSVKVTF